MTTPGARPGRWTAVRLARALAQGSIEALDAIHERYGDVVYVPAPVDAWVVFDAPAMRQVLQDDNKRYRKGANYGELAHVLGHSLVTSDGDRWIAQRRSVGKLFHREAARHHAAIAARVAQSWADRLTRAYPPGSVWDATRDVAELTCAIASEFLFGPVTERETRDLHRCAEAASAAALARIYALLRLPRWVPTRTHRMEEDARRRIDAFTYARIDRARAERVVGEPRSFLEALLDLVGETIAEPACRTEVRDHLVTLLFAGQDTMEAALGWFLMLCAGHPDVQDRIVAEHAQVPPAPAATPPYARAAFEETLRLYPPIPIVARTPIEDAEVGGALVPAGAVVLCAIRNAQRDPRYWSDAEAFKPERFLASGADQAPAFLAFGAGPRRCIGDRLAVGEALVVATTLLERLRLGLAPGYRPRTRTTIAMKPEPGLRLVAVPRARPLASRGGASS